VGMLPRPRTRPLPDIARGIAAVLTEARPRWRAATRRRSAAGCGRALRRPTISWGPARFRGANFAELQGAAWDRHRWLTLPDEALRSTAVANLSGRLPLQLTIDGELCESESTYNFAAGGAVLTITT